MKLGVCVPYRNRELHLHEFIPKVGKYLKEQGIEFQMYFAHQVDDKLFNRGAMKNIAAKHAFEEGCDYIVWHDIDMIPEKFADYTFPAEYPVHIATNISQMDYKLKYHEYFGGAVLFTKEQVEKTNGYSNDYWDWGMEDDDLFWRCHLEGLTNDSYLPITLGEQKFHRFNGNSSRGIIGYEPKFRGLTGRSHTISVLARAFQQPEKNPIFLIGSDEKRYVEYPIFRLPGYDYGISFNNSRAMTFQFWNSFNEHNYMWLKRYDNQWSWITAVIDNESQESRFYLNGVEVDSAAGHGSISPLKYNGKLKMYGQNDIHLGYTPSLDDNHPAKYFKGDIAKVYAWNRPLSSSEVENLHLEIPEDKLVIDIDGSTSEHDLFFIETEEYQENIKIPNSIVPHRKTGYFRCLPHPDEGIVNGKFAKGETTARNERRYVLEMQQGKHNYKEDGIKQVSYNLVEEVVLTPWAKMLNVTL